MGDQGAPEGERDAPIEVLESLALLELRVEREGGDIQEGHDLEEAADAVDGGEEDERTAGVAQEEVVEIRVLYGRKS